MCVCVHARVCVFKRKKKKSCIVLIRDTKSRSAEVWVCVGRPGRAAAANFPSANVNSQSGRLLHCSVQAGTKRDLWAKDPFSSIETHFKGSVYSRGPPWQLQWMEGWCYTSADRSGSEAGACVYSGVFALVFYIKNLLLPYRRNGNSCFHAVLVRKRWKDTTF